MPEEDSTYPPNAFPTPPPRGDDKKAQLYITKLVSLLDQDKITPLHTDLSRYDPSSLEDHYRVDLKNYMLEVSHSKQPNSGQDSYVMVFTNLNQVAQGCEKIILAFVHLNKDQFLSFKHACEESMNRKKRAEELEQFTQAVAPIDQLLDDLDSKESTKPSEDKSDPFDRIF